MQLPQKHRLFHTGKIHFVHKQKCGHLVAFQQPPQRQGMGLDAVCPADEQHGAVQNRKGTLRLCGKIHMAGGVHQNDFPMLRLQTGLLGKNGNPPGPFQGVGIQKGVPMIHPAQGTPGPRPIKQRLAQSGFPRIHMGK